MEVHWNTDVMMGIGNMLGYRRLSANLRNAMLRLGVTMERDAQISVQVRSPETYAPVKGKINIWATMFESAGLPPLFIENIRKADALVVPSNFVAEVFKPHVEAPVFVVPLGVDSSLFKLVRREWPADRPFRWLWAGAKNTRKGWNVIRDVWKMDGPRGRMLDNSSIELYIKTLDDNLAVLKDGNAYLDSRLIGDPELAQLYQSAHAFVFPTMCEGFGLMALESMATGLPCVMPLHTGIVDFAHEGVCYPVKYGEAELFIDSPVLQRAGTFRAPVFPVDLEDLYRQMWQVMDDYSHAVVVGAYASKRAAQFTWQNSAIAMRDALQAMNNGQNAGIMAVAS